MIPTAAAPRRALLKSVVFFLGSMLAGTGALPASAQQSTNGEAFLPVRHDAATGKVFLTVREMNEELLYLNTLAAGLGTASLDRGQLGSDAVVHFERRGPRVLMISRNTSHRAVGADAEELATVTEAFPSSVLASFTVASEGPEGVVVDATDYLLTDVYDVIGTLRSSGVNGLRIDPNRSFIDPENTGSYPANSEVRSVLTYVTDTPNGELRRLAPEGRAITLEQHHSFVRLPEQGLAMRAFDPRAGVNPASFFDFAQPFDSDYRQRGISRWRLEPRDPAAYQRGELVEPLKPIVYYLDRGVPEPYRSAFLEGGSWWNGVFEAAGWRNAFRVEVLPEGVDAMDARYPVIYWVHREQRGPSVGPSYQDPRTGEILSTVVRMDSYRSLVDHDIYMGLVPAAGANGLQMSPEEFILARRRQHAAHEIGHTIGLAHNFVAKSQERSSVMDYPYPLIELDRNGRIDISRAFSPSAGAHDTLAIRYAYTWYPNAEAEAAGLRQIVREAEARGMRFVTGSHANANGSYPEATQWIEGRTMIEALERTMAVRRRLIDSFDASAAQVGEPLAVLNRRFAHVYFHHRYALEGAIKAVGGMRFGYATAGEQTDPTEIVPASEQRRALELVLESLTPEQLHIPSRVAALIPPVPFGFDNDLAPIPSRAGTAFDPVGTAHILAQEIASNLLHPERAARLSTFHAQDRSNPSLDEVLTALIATVWNGPEGSEMDPQEPALRRVAQRAVLDAMLDLAGRETATPDVRAVTEHHLSLLTSRLATMSPSGADEAGHRDAAIRDIGRYFDGEDDPETRPRAPAVPLPWP